MDNLLISNITKSYGSQQVLKGFSTEFSTGFHFIFGKSGSGKSTLLRLVAGFEKPDSGTISGNQNSAFLFQEQNLLTKKSALKNLTLFFGRKYTEEAKNILLTIGLDGNDIMKPVSDLSGGMAQRVSIARLLLFASIHNPSVILLDEPFRGLDSQTKRAVAEMLIKAFSDCIVLVVSHDDNDCNLLECVSQIEIH